MRRTVTSPRLRSGSGSPRLACGLARGQTAAAAFRRRVPQPRSPAWVRVAAHTWTKRLQTAGTRHGQKHVSASVSAELQWRRPRGERKRESGAHAGRRTRRGKSRRRGSGCLPKGLCSGFGQGWSRQQGRRTFALRNRQMPAIRRQHPRVSGSHAGPGAEGARQGAHTRPLRSACPASQSFTGRMPRPRRGARAGSWRLGRLCEWPSSRGAAIGTRGAREAAVEWRRCRPRASGHRSPGSEGAGRLSPGWVPLQGR